MDMDMDMARGMWPAGVWDPISVDRPRLWQV